MTGQGGWVLSAKCVGCGAAGEFRGVVPGLAFERAASDGWELDGSQVLIDDAVRDACCPDCSR